ncbi:MAG: ribosomal protein S18 acetylase RimI-like enzyme [Polaribacter sp.]|jgi:ribosomal protein S18 acetylase RimI-like enzyme
MLKVFRANKGDQVRVANLFDQYRVFYKMKSDIKSVRKFINERLNNKDSIIYLAQLSGDSCGFIQIYPAFSSVAMRPIWILNDLFVDQSYRNKGCAKALMEQVRADATTSNIFSIKLATAVNNYQAKELYESIEYKKIDQFDNYSLKV